MSDTETDLHTDLHTDIQSEPVTESKPRRRKSVEASQDDAAQAGSTESADTPEVAEAPAPVAQAPAAPRTVKARVLLNYFHDGQRFRARGEVISVTEEALARLPQALARV
jgi:hypothetical protein